MVDLSIYADNQQRVRITLRNGDVWEGAMVTHDGDVWEGAMVTREREEEEEGTYLVENSEFSEFFYQNGQYYSHPSMPSTPTMHDIVSVVPYETMMPEPEKNPNNEAVYVARFDGVILCALPERNRVKEYLKAEYPNLDPYDITITLETLGGNPLK